MDIQLSGGRLHVTVDERTRITINGAMYDHWDLTITDSQRHESISIHGPREVIERFGKAVVEAQAYVASIR